MNAGREAMRAVRFQEYGDPDVLEVREIPVPVPGPDEVLVRVHAAGLNPKDAMIRSGALGLQAGRTLPRGTGFDFAGEVAEAGSGVSDLPVGTAVWGFLDGVLGGAAADYVVAPRAWVAPAPAGLSWLEAASLPLAGSAALQALRDVARVRPGERVLVRGAAGGVGSAAVQVAKLLGARVTAAARRGALPHARTLGADMVLDAATLSLSGHRFDVVLDCVGCGPVRLARDFLAPGGRWVAVAPSLPVFALAPLTGWLGRRLGMRSFGFVVVRPRSGDLAWLADQATRGALRVSVTAAYPLEHVRDSHRDLEEGGARGKRVLAVSDAALAEAAEAGLLDSGVVAAGPRAPVGAAAA
ncbi:MAG: dehydrogenase [Gemmatimonadota bacterium]